MCQVFTPTKNESTVAAVQLGPVSRTFPIFSALFHRLFSPLCKLTQRRLERYVNEGTNLSTNQKKDGAVASMTCYTPDLFR